MWTNKLSLFEDQTDLNNLPGIAYSLDLKITFLNLQTLAMLSVATILFGVDMFQTISTHSSLIIIIQLKDGWLK